MSRMLQMTTEILPVIFKIVDSRQSRPIVQYFTTFVCTILVQIIVYLLWFLEIVQYNIHSLCIQLTFCAPALTSKQSQSCFWNPKFGFAIVRVLRTACSASATLSPVTEIMQAATMVTEREMPARLENQKRRVDSSTT